MLSPFDIVEILSMSKGLLGIAGIKTAETSKKRTNYSFGANWRTAKNVELMTKLKERFGALDSAEDKLPAKLQDITALLGNDCRCGQDHIARMLKDMRTLSMTNGSKEEKEVLEALQVNLAKLVADHAEKLKGKFELSDIYAFYNNVIATCQPLEKLNPAMHSALMADVTRDLGDLQKDMDHHIAMVANNSIKDHENKAMRAKWISRSLAVVGLACVIVGACTFHMGGGVLIGIGFMALSGAVKFYHSQKGHETKIENLKTVVKNVGGSDKDVGVDLKQGEEILRPVNDLIAKLKSRTDTLDKRSSI